MRTLTTLCSIVALCFAVVLSCQLTAGCAPKARDAGALHALQAANETYEEYPTPTPSEPPPRYSPPPRDDDHHYPQGRGGLRY